jgi:hypothetical protein
MDGRQIGERIIVQGGNGFRRQVSRLDSPLVVLLQEDGPDQAGDGGEENGSEEEIGTPVITGVNASPILEAGKYVFDTMTLAVQAVVVDMLGSAVPHRRDARRDTSCRRASRKGSPS